MTYCFYCQKNGGEAGIRTLGGSRLNGFQDRRFRPLSHLSRNGSIDVQELDVNRKY